LNHIENTKEIIHFGTPQIFPLINRNTRDRQNERYKNEVKFTTVLYRNFLHLVAITDCVISVCEKTLQIVEEISYA